MLKIDVGAARFVQLRQDRKVYRTEKMPDLPLKTVIGSRCNLSNCLRTPANSQCCNISFNRKQFAVVCRATWRSQLSGVDSNDPVWDEAVPHFDGDADLHHSPQTDEQQPTSFLSFMQRASKAFNWFVATFVALLSLAICSLFASRKPLQSSLAFASMTTATTAVVTPRPLASTSTSISQPVRSMKGPVSQLEEASAYRFVRMLSSRKTATKLAGIVVVIAPILVVGGFLFGRVTQTPLRESLYEAYTILVNMPGADATNLDRPVGAKVVASLLYMGHMILFATLLGIIIDDFTTYVDELRSGSYPVCESGHIVVLNWNQQSPSLVRQFAIARTECSNSALNKPVVILADKDKDEMDDIVADALGDGLQLDVITRNGLPYSVEQLNGINAGKAGRVIVLYPDDKDPQEADMLQGAQLAALKRLGADGFSQNILVQVSGSDRPFLHSATEVLSEGPTCQTFNVHTRLQRLMAQTAIAPGTADVVASVLEQSTDSAEFYIKDLPSFLEGNPYSVVRRCVPGCVVVGYQRLAQEPVLNPSESDVLQAGDKVVVLSNTAAVKFATPQVAESLKEVVQTKEASPKSVAERAAAKQKVNARKEVVVLGWQSPHTFSQMSNGLADFAPPGSTVTVVGMQKPEDFKSRVGNVTFKFVEADYQDVESWEHVIKGCVDAVIIGPAIADQNNFQDDSDAQVIANVLHLQDLYRAKGCSQPLHVVSCIKKHTTQELGLWLVRHGRENGINMSLDFLQPDELMGGMLTQVAAQPELLGVIREVASVESTEGDLGPEIVLHRPQVYGLPVGEPITFIDLSELVRAQGDTPIGYIQEDGTVRTAPEDAEEIVLGDKSKVVVISSDFQSALVTEQLMTKNNHTKFK